MKNNFYPIYFISMVISWYAIPALWTYNRQVVVSPLLPWRNIRESLTVGVIILTIVGSVLPIVNLVFAVIMLINISFDIIGKLWSYRALLAYKPFATKK